MPLEVLLTDNLPSIRKLEPRFLAPQQVPVLYRQRRTSNDERLPLPLLSLLDLLPPRRQRVRVDAEEGVGELVRGGDGFGLFGRGLGGSVESGDAGRRGKKDAGFADLVKPRNAVLLKRAGGDNKRREG
jgi:hypothetical protein